MNENENAFDYGNMRGINDNDYSLLLSGESENEQKNEQNNQNENNKNIANLSDKKTNKKSDKSVSTESENDTEGQHIIPGVEAKKDKTDPASETGLKMVDISATLSKKGPANAYFVETLPEIKQSMMKYKQKGKIKSNYPENKISPDDVQIIRTNNQTNDQTNNTIENANSDKKKQKTKLEKKTNDIIDNVLKT